MEQITEDYCTFEIAKLLKEKGFNEHCSTSYNTILSNHKVEKSNVSECGRANQIYRPSQAMAMKWLRVNFGYNILIIADGDLGDLHYSYEIQEIDNKLLQVNGSLDIEDQRFDTYEEACEAAIKYCLDNLI
jgi:hypothetical protein